MKFIEYTKGFSVEYECGQKLNRGTHHGPEGCFTLYEYKGGKIININFKGKL